MEQIFNVHKNFNLHTQYWGNVKPDTIIELLDSVIINFYSKLDDSKIPKATVYVENDFKINPLRKYPEIIFKETRIEIFLFLAQDNLWLNYSFEFSHELCYYVIDNFLQKNKRFKWLEESICELAAIYTYYTIDDTWQINSTYSNWRRYLDCFKDLGCNEGFKPENILRIPFSAWLKDNLDKLCEDEYFMRKQQQLNSYSSFISNFYGYSRVMENNSIYKRSYS